MSSEISIYQHSWLNSLVFLFFGYKTAPQKKMHEKSRSDEKKKKKKKKKKEMEH